MFVGHLAVALASKRVNPRASLGWYVAGVTTLDLIWPILLILGVEHASIVPGATAFNALVFDSYPWSHSLLMSIVWGALLAGLARWAGVDARACMLIGACVLSHWVLDWITHTADLPLWPGNSPRFGLGLWNSVPGTFAVEGALWVFGLTLYLQHRRSSGWVGRVAFWSLVLLCTVMWAAGPWSPPPPSTTALGWFALIGWIVVPWAAWADRNYQETAVEAVTS
ncbi:MAG: metal-dependent hydrolase [Gemmatimonadales bacterium]